MWRRKRRTTTTTTTTATTGTTSTPTTTVSTPTTTVSTTTTAPPVLRGSRLGISAGSFASTQVLDGCVELGLGWVRVSHEYGWNTLDGLSATVQAAHARGLKVIQAVQNSGHAYSDPTKNAGLASFAVECWKRGVDALEVGNEWQHQPFWTTPLYSTMPPVAQAELSISVAKAVRDAFPDAVIITNGLSPEANSQNPYIWMPAFWDVNVAGHAAVKWNGIGLHPYVYPELATTNPVQWNGWKQIPTIIADARARGIGAQMWLTEIGCPGFAVNAPVVRNVALTETQQNACYQAYFEALRGLEAQGYRIPLTAFATLFDGQSVTTSIEQGLGLIRQDGTKKPAWYSLRAFAAEVVG